MLAGISGGADSVALAHVLHYLQERTPFSLTLAHLHHGIRGEDADEDRDFVRQLAWKLGAPCVDEQVDVPAWARRRRISLEMAAREARQEFFRRTAAAVGADRVATAHHADDEAELVLLRILRGAGTQGLAGLAPAGRGTGGLRMIRPLAEVTREEIESFLRAHGIAWREDRSNRDPLILRNRVRHDLLPYLEEHYQPGLRAVLRRTAAVLREENAWLEQQAARVWARCRAGDADLDVRRLAAAPLALRRRVWLLWLRAKGMPPGDGDFRGIARLEALLESSRGSARITLAHGWTVERRYGRLCARGPAQRVAVAGPVEWPVPGVVVWGGLRCSAGWSRGYVRPRDSRVGRWPEEASLDRARLAGAPLVVRAAQRGDWIRPWGLAGRVKLQDVFVNAKVPRQERARVPVVTCREEIVWVPGYRVAQDWAVPGPSAPSVRLRMEPDA